MISLYYTYPGKVSIQKLYGLADERTKKEFDRSSKGAGAYMSLLGKVLLRTALEKYGIDSDKAAFVKNKYGKEYLSDNAIFFNVSHTSGLVCVAVSDTETGVDCETLRDINCIDIAKRFFTENEHRSVSEAYDRKEEFFKTWTKKESYIKYKSCGFFMSLSSFDVKDIEKIQSVCKINDTYVALSGDISHVEYVKTLF